jgi:hypothetical protein
MAGGIYYWVRSKGVPVLPSEQFFASELQLSRKELQQTKPSDFAHSLLKIFAEYHQEDPSSKAWSSGLDVIQEWMRLIEKQEVSRSEVSALVEITVENEQNFLSSTWTQALIGICNWCKTLGYPDLIPEKYQFLLK